MSNQPILIIGAPRSGTKFLREMLRLHPDIVGPKYELERIWCYKNMNRYNMPIAVEKLNPEIKSYIHDFFEKLSKKNHGRRIVAKSTLLPLRIPFIRAVFPLAPMLHIVRDGRDSACSIMERTKKPLELGYMLKHRVYPPIVEIPYYLNYFIKCQFEKLVLRQKHVKKWGPQFDDMAELIDNHTFIEVCGIQWKRSVMGIHESIDLLNEGPYLQIHYEELVQKPVKTMKQVLGFLGMSMDPQLKTKMQKNFSKGQIARWQQDLSIKDQQLLTEQIKTGLSAFGYL